MYVNQPLRDKKSKKRGLLWKIPLIIISLLLIVAIAYVVYVFVDYNRIEDNVAVEPQGSAELSAVKTGTEYTALTYNVGFGAYTPDFTFFMDGGKSSWAESKESVIAYRRRPADSADDHDI